MQMCVVGRHEIQVLEKSIIVVYSCYLFHGINLTAVGINPPVILKKKGRNLAWMNSCLSPVAHNALLDFLPRDLSSQKLNSVWELFQSSSIRFSSAPFLRPKQRWWRLLVHAIFEPILSRSCAVAI
jgi:hypothetical protein